MQIKFHTKRFNVLDTINHTNVHLQVKVDITNPTIDELLDELAVSTGHIEVFDDDGQLSAVYNGFTEEVAIYIVDDHTAASVELENGVLITNLQAQIDSLNASQESLTENVELLNTTQEEQDEVIDMLLGFDEEV